MYTFAELYDGTTANSTETRLKDHKRQSHASETASAVQHDNTSTPPSEGSQKPPFGCGCGKCMLLSFVERRCPSSKFISIPELQWPQ